ncbi:PKD domain-containing protein [Marinicrinis sediminis]|uniref:PKD domain-containing protein n=1 Tax=Marinicrinis sediminis TaxID=1652465 RepID=UPI0036D3BCF7
MEVFAEDLANPGFRFCQHANGDWSTKSSYGDIGTIRVSDADGEPSITYVKTYANIPNPKDGWVYSDGSQVSEDDSKNIMNIIPDKNKKPEPQGRHAVDRDAEVDATNNKVIIEGPAGKGILKSTLETGFCGGNNEVNYAFPVKVYFVGKLIVPDEFMGLEISPTERTLNVGESQHFTVHASWKQNGTTKKYEVSDNKLSWSSNASAKVPVDAFGIVNGQEPTPGTSHATITAYFAEQNASVSAKVRVIDPDEPPPDPDPDPVYITGDFDIVPSAIDWRDPFVFQPKDIETGSCSYQSHQYRIQRGSSSYMTPNVSGETTNSAYSESTYPWIISIGSHQVSMKIIADCGESDWIGPKTLTVNGPSDNGPPTFELGWTTPGVWTMEGKQTEVVQGTYLDLVYLDEPAPADPDGDMIEDVIWDFSSSNRWVKNIPNQYSAYTNGYHQIEMNELGYHSACALMRDEFGAESRKCTYVRVVPPNPIPVAQCPAEVKDNRPVDASLFGSRQSYSPMGRAIDHTKDEWTNKQAAYTNPTTDLVLERVQLHVYDAAGLKSLQPDECEITVLPDLPPLANLDVPPLGIRGQSFDLINQSASPDGDQLVAATYQYKYDAHNNGFEDDSWQPLTGSMQKAVFSPKQVGKYLFYIEVTEDYGRQDDTLDVDVTTLTMDVINEAPSVSFEVEGENRQPNLNLPEVYTPSDIRNQFELYQTNTNLPIENTSFYWYEQGGKLKGSMGKGIENIYSYSFNERLNGQDRQEAWDMPMRDFGYGPNNLNPYRAVESTSETMSTLIGSANNRNQIFSLFSVGSDTNIQSNLSYIFIDQYWGRDDTSGGVSSKNIYAINKEKINKLHVELGFYTQSYHYDSDEPFDFVIDRDYLGKHEFDYALHANYSNPPRYTDSVHPNIVGYQLADRTLYVLVQYYHYRDSPNGDRLRGYSYIIHTFDAYSGEKLGDTSAHLDINNYSTNQQIRNRYASLKRPDRLQPKGDNLVLLNLYYYGDEQAIEINRKGEVVKQSDLGLPDPTTLECEQNVVCKDHQRRVNEIYKDGNGSYYFYDVLTMRYRQHGSDHTYTSKPYITKIGPDLKVDWRKPLTGRSISNTTCITHVWGDPKNTAPSILIDSLNGKVYTKSYTNGASFACHTYMEGWDIETGNVIATPADMDVSSNFTNTELLWNGFLRVNADEFDDKKQTVTKDGRITRFYDRTYNTDMNTLKRHYVFDTSNQMKTYVNQPTMTIQFGGNTETVNGYGGYYGDGIYLSTFDSTTMGYDCNLCRYLVVTVQPPSTHEPNLKPFSLGQFLSPETKDNHTLNFTMNMLQARKTSDVVGMSFRAQDGMNRYALEIDGASLALVKYENGSRSVLQSAAYPFQDQTAYAIQIDAVEDRISVRLNQVPYLEVIDRTYTAGKFGPFSDKPHVSFSSISSMDKPAPDIELADGYAIWEPELGYGKVDYTNLVFEDPENDPQAGTYSWTLTHTPKFIANQGLSALHGQTFSDAQLHLDKVGRYDIALRAQDDPHPDYKFPSTVFADYREDSNPFQASILVHRRPVSKYSVIVGGDDKVYWTDSSYDPDRYASSTVYSTEATGIDYLATRGIMERTYFYVSPSGEEVMQRLIVPTEAGVYTVGLAVKDEYGAWSEWNIQSVTITDVPQNAPPNPGFTLNKTSTHRGDPITINSTASDPEDGGRTNLDHAYYIRNTGTGVESYQSNSRTNWQKSFSSLGTFQIRQVVRDSVGQEAEMTRSVHILNRLPSAVITYPASSDQNHPTVVKDDTPTITWTYGDADSDSQQRYQVKIYRYGGVLLQDSGVVTSSSKSWTPTTALPDKTNLYVIVRVHDGYAWSLDSEPAYMYIHTNEPPDAQFDWSPKPVWEGDTVTLTNQSTDPDGDPLTYQWRITDPSGQTRSYTSRHVTALFSQIGRYRVELTVSDGEEQDTVTRTIEALELKLEPSVYHTPEWKQIHDDRGHETEQDPKDFYSGELFKLEAVTSPAPVVEITAKLTGTGRQNNVIRIDTTLTASGTPQHYRGDLYDKVLMSMERGLKEGLEDIVFEIEYANGVTKQAVVEVNIIGLAKEIVGVHRVR